MHRKPKVSHGRLVRVGLVRPKGVADGHQVDNPELTYNCLKGGGTQEDRHASDWKSLLSSEGRVCRKIRRSVRN